MSYIEKTRALQVPNPDKLIGMVIGAEGQLFAVEWDSQTCRVQIVGYTVAHTTATRRYDDMVRLASRGPAAAAGPTIDRVVASLAEIVCVAMQGTAKHRDLALRYMRCVAEGLLTPDQATLRLVSPETMTQAEGEENSRWLANPIWAGIAKRDDAAKAVAEAIAGDDPSRLLHNRIMHGRAADECAAARWLQEARLHRQYGRRLPPLGRFVAGL